MQNSSDFFYRITRVVPLPVASIDGEAVPYSNYLVGYRSQAHYLEFKEGVNLQAADSKSQLDYIKRKAMDDAIADAYAAKIARANQIRITDQELNDAMVRQRQSRDGTASEETYGAIIRDHFNWTLQEAREVTSRKLLRQNVSYAIDANATKDRDAIVAKLQTEKDFDKVAAAIGGSGTAKIEPGVRQFVPRNNQDGGLAAMAATLQKGQISNAFKSTSGDGYYIVKLLDVDNDSRISYAYLKIPLTEFTSRLSKAKAENKVSEYITIPAIKVAPITAQ